MPEPSAIDSMHSWNASEFEDWLRDRLARQHHPDASVREEASDFCQLGILPAESNRDAFETLYSRLAPRAQAAFHQAIEGLLRKVKPGVFPASAFADLLHLVGRTRAFGALAAFPSVLGRGEWGHLHRFLFFDATSVLLKLVPSLEAYECAQALVTSPQFAAEYTFDCYRVMLRGRPERWTEDLGLIRGRIPELASLLDAKDGPESFSKKAQRMGSFLSRAVPLSEIAKQLDSVYWYRREKCPDLWLARALFATDALGIEYDGPFMSLYDLQKPERGSALIAPTSVFALAYPQLQSSLRPAELDSVKDPKVLEILVNMTSLGRIPRATAAG